MTTASKDKVRLVVECPRADCQKLEAVEDSLDFLAAHLALDGWPCRHDGPGLFIGLA